jgi:hypothetical protein
MTQRPLWLLILEMLALLVCWGLLARLTYGKNKKPVAAFLLTSISTGFPCIFFYLLLYIFGSFTVF